MRIDRLRLYDTLRRKDLTQKSFAAKAGISRATVSNALCGKSCSEITVQKMARALNVDLSEIVQEA